MTDRTGFFVTFEGPEGGGKSTQTRLLAERLRSLGRKVVTTFEPGGTPLGERLRSVLLAVDDYTVGAEAETLLFCAARSQLVVDVLRPALADGAVVICDRYADSTIAYQHYGRGLPLPWVQQAIALAIDGLWPDLSILLDVPPRVGLARKRGPQQRQPDDQPRPISSDRIELAGEDFHERVHLGYHCLAQAEPRRWLVIDGSQPVEAVADQISAVVLARLADREHR